MYHLFFDKSKPRKGREYSVFQCQQSIPPKSNMFYFLLATAFNLAINVLKTKQCLKITILITSLIFSFIILKSVVCISMTMNAGV